MRAATGGEIGRWDELVAANPDGGHILQTRAWGEFKAEHGWRPHYAVGETGGRPLAILLLGRSIPGLGPLWYAPKGPGVSSGEELVGAAAGLRSFSPAFTVKAEPELEEGTAGAGGWEAAGIVKSRHDIQVTRATIVVDLDRDEDELLASFKPKCRYNIRLAERKGVEVRRVGVRDDTMEVMHRLMTATHERAGFLLRSRRYFEGYWRLQHACGQGDLFFAFYGGEVLAGAFVTSFAGRAWYKDGGSVKRHASVMAPHLLQWEVMRELRRRGVRSYDLVAVPPPGELSPEHPLFGLYRFKSGFSDEITEFVGTWDVVVEPRRYRLWRLAGERLADQWSYRVRRDLFY